MPRTTEPSPGPTPSPSPGPRHRIGAYVGLAGLAPLLFLVLASVLMAPTGAVVALTVVWLLLFGLALRWFVPHPWRVAALPLVMLVVWLGTLSLGDAVLGWTA